VLELRHISKSFPGVHALVDVSLEFRAGEIHGLIGENGAGKSTAIKLMTGLHSPDTGEIVLDRHPVTFPDHRAALVQGIGLVPQELQVIPDASVAENVMLDKLVTHRFGAIDWPATERAAAVHLARVGLDVPPEQPARGLSAARKQLLQIAKALSAKVRVLILDEPTSSLTEHEAHRLFALLRELRDQGVAIIFVSHKLEEVLGLCDRVSVLRDGRFVATRETAQLTSVELVQLMIGRECNDDHLGPLSPDPAVEVLRAEHLVRAGHADDVSFVLHRGEILGFYGLVGAGRTEVARLLIGEEPMDSGRVLIRGQVAVIRNAGHALYGHRLGYVTENRKEEGLFLDDSVQTNLTLAVWPRLRRAWNRCIDSAAETVVARRFVDALQIRPPTLEQRVRHLSGGNQQKVSLGKWLAADCDILIIDEPTVGVDIGAKRQIHELIWNLAAKEGKSVILISSDLPEIVRVAHRLLVFREHRIVGEVREIDVQRKSYAEVSREIAPYLAGTIRSAKTTDNHE
jgi:ribose transport system ATP-binding protein